MSAADTTASEHMRLIRTVVEIREHALLRSRDASLEPSERAQWRRMAHLCQRAMGEADG